MKTILPILALAFACNLAPAAEQIIATADFKSVYKEYWRTKLANKKLKDEQDKLQKDLGKHIAGQKALDQEVARMVKALNIPNLTPLQLQRRRDAVNKKRQEFIERNKAIDIFRRGKLKKIQEDDRNERDAIVGEIKVVVAAKAKQGGFTLVLAKNSVLFTDNSADLTQSIITQLNINDPDKVKPPAPKKK
jgi:Skp family chaperone for outer membrane proteins